jgi:hypothetical protein
MHENREISCTSWSSDQDRSAKAINRTADMNVQEKSDCAVVPVNQPNNEGQQPSAEAGEGRAQTEENIVQSHMRPTQSGKRMSQGLHVCGKQCVSPPFIHSKSRMRKRARTDLRGGRSAMVVPTATSYPRPAWRRSLGRVVRLPVKLLPVPHDCAASSTG